MGNELSLNLLRLISPELSPTTALPSTFTAAVEGVLRNRGPAILESLQVSGPERLDDFPGLPQMIHRLCED